MLGGNRTESGIIILYSASQQGYLVLAVYKHALLLLYYYIYIYIIIILMYDSFNKNTQYHVVGVVTKEVFLGYCS